MSETKREIANIRIDSIKPMPTYPFVSRKEEEMNNLIGSIGEHGLQNPISVLPAPNMEGFYFCFDGMRRIEALKAMGATTVPCTIHDITMDEAIIRMVDFNLSQRQTISHSEKAFSYKLRYEAMKRQTGRRSEKNVSPEGTHLKERRSLDEMGDIVGESRNQIHRYIRLTSLIPPLLDLVDAESMKIKPAVEISVTTQDYQRAGAVW